MTAVDTSSAMVSSTPRTNGEAGVLRAIAAWLMTSDHKRIGRLMVTMGAMWTAVVAVVGALLGFERIDAVTYFVDSDSVVQLFSLLRVGLIFGVMAPVMLGLAVAIVPLQIGARSLAFARGALFGVYLWLFGMILIGASYIGNGGSGGGDAQMVDLFLLGMGLTILGLLTVSTCVATTVLTSRCPGMTLARTPVFAWSAFVTSVSLMLTLPVMAGALVYVAVDHVYERSTFGGNEGIPTWIGWALTQPQTFLFAIPTLGILAEITAVMSRGRQPLRGGLFLGIGVMSTALIGTVTQSFYSLQLDGDLAKTAKSLAPFLLFNALPILGVLIIMALCLLAIKNYRPVLNAAFIPAFLGVGMVFTGMVGNAVQRVDSFELANTVFEEAVLVYIGYGVVLSALGAIAYWGPKLWGRTMPAAPVMGLGVLGLLGVVLASLPYYIAGFAGQPDASAGGFDYLGPAWLWNTTATAGHALVLFVVIAFIALAVKSFRSGVIASDDPVVMSSESLLDLKASIRRQVVVLTGLFSAASAMLMGSMLAIWLQFRANAPLRKAQDDTKMLRDWLPTNIKIPEVATNTMMVTFVITCIMAQWAVYSVRRNDSKHTSLALSVVLLTEIALINAQLAVYLQMDIGVRDGSYMMMFYAVTATMMALIVIGMGFTLLALFRSFAGRLGDHDLVGAHSLYWYSLAVIFAVMWFVVYVQK